MVAVVDVSLESASFAYLDKDNTSPGMTYGTGKSTYTSTCTVVEYSLARE